MGTGNRRTIVLTAAMLIGTSCSSPAERGVAQQPTEEAIALFDYDSSLPLDLQTHGIESSDGLDECQVVGVLPQVAQNAPLESADGVVRLGTIAEGEDRYLGMLTPQAA